MPPADHLSGPHKDGTDRNTTLLEALDRFLEGDLHESIHGRLRGGLIVVFDELFNVLDMLQDQSRLAQPERKRIPFIFASFQDKNGLAFEFSSFDHTNLPVARPLMNLPGLKPGVSFLDDPAS